MFEAQVMTSPVHRGSRQVEAASLSSCTFWQRQLALRTVRSGRLLTWGIRSLGTREAIRRDGLQIDAISCFLSASPCSLREAGCGLVAAEPLHGAV